MVRDFSTAKDLLAFFLEDAEFRPRHVLDAITDDYVFRGQANVDLPLLPAAHRCDGALRQFSPQAPGDPAQYAERPARYLQLHLHAERLPFMNAQFTKRLDHGVARTVSRLSTTLIVVA
jgi:hypothetical protein